MHSGVELQGAFRALADPSRREILSILRDRDMTVGEVASHFEMTRAAVKKHLIVLEEGQLISAHRRGRETINRLEPLKLKATVDWFDHFSHFWDEKLASLKHAVETAEGKNNGQ